MKTNPLTNPLRHRQLEIMSKLQMLGFKSRRSGGTIFQKDKISIEVHRGVILGWDHKGNQHFIQYGIENIIRFWEKDLQTRK